MIQGFPNGLKTVKKGEIPPCATLFSEKSYLAHIQS